MTIRFMAILAMLSYPLAACALPPETPHYPDCAQPWDKPGKSASDFEWNGWTRVANSYVSCLSDHQQESYDNASQFADAYNELLTVTQARLRDQELSYKEAEDAERTLETYKRAFEAWKQSGDDAEADARRFARDNGGKITSK